MSSIKLEEMVDVTTPDPTVMFFDQFQRYHTAAELIRMMENETASDNPAPLRILEVGANEHRDLGKELLNAEIWYTDLHLPESMEGDDHCFMADATNLEGVEDDAYDYTIAMDVFEHIPQDKRAAFLTEVARVSKVAAVICFPYNAPEVAVAEEEVNGMYRELFGESHPWLREHIENGLPDRNLVENVLNENGIAHTSFTHGSLSVWKRMIVLNFFIDEEAFNAAASEANIHYNRRVYPFDTAADADYRVFYVLAKQKDLPDAIQNPFAGKHISMADLSPIDRALNLISG